MPGFANARGILSYIGLGSALAGGLYRDRDLGQLEQRPEHGEYGYRGEVYVWVKDGLKKAGLGQGW